MYKYTLQNGKTAGYYMDEIPDGTALEDYISVSIPADDTCAAKELHRRGFLFADRSLPLKISIKNFRPAINVGRKFHTSVIEDWALQDIYNIAKETFDGDCRFALDLHGDDTNLKNELLQSFIMEQKRKGVMAALLYRDGQLIGFNLWNISGDTGRILLGAVSAPYRNTGIGIELYSCTVNAMKGQGVETLRDIVATSNTASLNLHAMIFRGGALRFGQCRDYYKKELFINTDK